MHNAHLSQAAVGRPGRCWLRSARFQSSTKQARAIRCLSGWLDPVAEFW